MQNNFVLIIIIIITSSSIIAFLIPIYYSIKFIIRKRNIATLRIDNVSIEILILFPKKINRIIDQLYLNITDIE